jgi:hypothetical protein
MHNCHDDVLGYHDDEVTLPQSERTAMKDRRNANRDRLKKGLKEAKKPSVKEFASQGSYAMKNMTQHPDNDWDIDDGVYFDKIDLVGPRGGDMSSLEARQMVRDAVDDGSFKKKPEVRANCVRIFYDAGYHVDQPVYRRISKKDANGNQTFEYELASSEWKRSDARDVTAWFEKENDRQSPDTSNGQQLRRHTRYLKKLARSRANWEARILSGFGITKLVAECFRGSAGREDESMYNTMVAIRDRLNGSLVINHPVTPNETITDGNDDPKAKFFKEKLTEAIDSLKPTHALDCTRTTALSCWDKVFNTDYFGEREKKDVKVASASIVSAGILKESGQRIDRPVQKDGGGRYA